MRENNSTRQAGIELEVRQRQKSRDEVAKKDKDKEILNEDRE